VADNDYGTSSVYRATILTSWYDRARCSPVVWNSGLNGVYYWRDRWNRSLNTLLEDLVPHKKTNLLDIKRITLTAVITLLVLFSCVSSANDSALLPDGHDAIIFIRHAIAPGTGDPVDFDVDNCSTQRNLSELGRQQAKAIGSKLRDLGVFDLPVYTSQWCRCKETAELMDTGTVEIQPLLNSFFASPSDGPLQLENLGQWLSTIKGPLVLVTHQVVITGMTDVYPASGEMVVTRLDSDGMLKVVSTIETDYP